MVIQKSELVAFLSNITRCLLMTFYAETTPTLRKGKGDDACPDYLWKAMKEGRLVKIAKVAAVVNSSYESCVNRQRQREELPPDFVAALPSWGHRKDDCPPLLVEHNDGDYLAVKVNKSLKYEYRIDGKLVEKAEVNRYLPPKTAGRQQVAEPVLWRKYKLENIRQIRAKTPLSPDGIVVVVD